MPETSIELVDAHGRKVRVNISGHWQDLVDRIEHRVLRWTTEGPETSLGLSDLEYGEAR